MTNKEIARVLYDIGDILEIRARASFGWWLTATRPRSLEFLPDDVTKLYTAGGLKALEDIPGVGPSIAQKTEELIRTGKLKYYERIQKAIPPVPLELTKISNVGMWDRKPPRGSTKS